MKMQILYSMVLGSLLCSCHSVNDVMNAEADPGVLREDTLLLLPTGSVDRSQVKELSTPDPNVDWTQNGVLADELYPTTKFIQLGDIPDDHIDVIQDILIDDGLYFVAYTSKDRTDDGNKFYRYSSTGSIMYSNGFAIFNAKGKLVSQLPNDEGKRYSLRLNRKQKEVCLFDGHRIDCYDYKGNYLRTDFLRLNVADLYFVNGTRIGVVEASYTLNLKNSLVVFDAEGRPVRLLRQPNKTGGLSFFQNGDALYAHSKEIAWKVHDEIEGDYYQGEEYADKKDTIWQITPTAFKARYAMPTCKRTPSSGNIYSENTIILHHYLFDKNSAMLNTTTFYDLPSGKLTMLRKLGDGDDNAVYHHKFTSLATLPYLHYSDYPQFISPSSNTLIMQCNPLNIKRAFVNSLKATDPDILTHNKRYEKWVRSLKLDGNPILVIESRR